MITDLTGINSSAIVQELTLSLSKTYMKSTSVTVLLRNFCRLFHSLCNSLFCNMLNLNHPSQ